MRDNLPLLFILSILGIAAWIAFTTPDIEDIELTEEDWGL
jgi:hypothetical protein